MNETEYQAKWRGRGWTRERVEDALAVYLPGWHIRDENWEPVNAHDKAPLICSNGHPADRQCGDIRKRHGCTQCKAESIRAEMAAKFIDALEKDGYTPLFSASDYQNNRQKLPTLCPAGNKYLTNANKFIDHGARCTCPACDPRKGKPPKRRTKDEAIAELRELDEEIVGEYIDTKTPVLSRCIKCGYERKIRPDEYFSGRSSCAKCVGRYKVTTEEYRTELNTSGWDLPEGVEYVNKYTPIPHRCPRGHVTMKWPTAWRSGSGCSICAREKLSEERRGVNPITGEALPPERLVELEESRKAPEYDRWRREVLERDGHACVLCGSTSDLNVHHLYSFANFPELRYEVDNGVTLCEMHHLNRHPGSFHALYGQDGQTTADQFIEYIDNFIANASGAELERLFCLRAKIAQFVAQVSRAQTESIPA